MITKFHLFILLLLPFGIFAQTTNSNRVVTTTTTTTTETEIERNLDRSFELGVGVGAMNYQGDIIPSAFDISNAALGYSVFGRYNFSQKFAIRLGYVGGSTKADDNNYASRGSRGYSFTGKVNEVHVAAELAPFAKSMYNDAGEYEFRKHTTPYVFIGAALGNTTPTTKVKSEKTTNESGFANNYISVPFGVGLRYSLNEKTKLGVEVGMRYTNSDFIDGFSKRANPNNNDTYTFAALKLSFALNGRDRETTK
jgi:opacity protein-like surface antigen